jgi:Helicase HerA, central domain
MDGRETPDDLAVATWSFRPRPRRESGRPEDLSFRSALLEALRSGHGLGLDLTMDLTSGPEASLTLRTGKTASARWFARVARPVHPSHQWTACEPRPRSRMPSRDGWRARRGRNWPEPLVSEGSDPVLDRWASALSACPSGVRVELRLSAEVVSALRSWDRLPAETLRARPNEPWHRRDPRVVAQATLAEGVPARPLFWRLSIWVTVEYGSPASRSHCDPALALEAASRTPRGNGLAFRPGRPSSWAPSAGSFFVSLDEVVSFWPSPVCLTGAHALSHRSPRPLLPLGRTPFGVVVGPAIEPHQGRHVAVLGETGMGKSSLLVALGRRALGNAGGVVFDPLGETVRALRRELGPSQLERSRWIAPNAPDVGMNALEGIGFGELDDPVRSERRLNDLVHALRRVRSGRYAESGFWGPRLEEMVTRALRAAASLPSGTLLDAHTLLATSARSSRPIPPQASEAVRELADRIRERPEDADGARRLLNEVARSPVLVRMLCVAQPTLRTRDLVSPGRIVLISGDAARVGESTARYLLSVLLALVWSELLARPDPTKTFVVLDEAQWFSHDSLAEMLRLGRRKNVHVVLATQAIASLPETVREAVWTNVSDFVAFRGSPDEAREFSRAAPEIPAEAILSLPRGEAAVLIGKGETVRWVRTARLPSRPGPADRPGQDAAGADSPSFPSEPDSSPLDVGSPADVPPIEAVWAELGRIADRAVAADPILVDLNDLRRRVDPGGSLVRHVGSVLARGGALVRVEHTGDGTRWVVDRGRLAFILARPPGSPPAETGSAAPQPS